MLKIGILGGGQLGQMFLQNAFSYPFQLFSLDPDPQAPCASFHKNFRQGALQDYSTVFEFGKYLDVITIEIENVNTQALKDLERIGKKVYPQPHIIELIADKRLQKEFFKENNFPTADFISIENASDIPKHLTFLPAFQKLAKGGYDGKGVQRLENAQDLNKAFEGASLLEKKVTIIKEIAVIVARNQKNTAVYDPVEMVFDEKLNLVDYLLAPATLSPSQTETAKKLAISLIEKLEMVGILAVEMFVDEKGDILLNELAPRPHNSGHHSIEACYTSQYDQHLRAITNLPLGNTQMRYPFVGMLNIIGAEGYQGEAHYEGLEKVLALEKVYIHLYNKSMTKAGRKMGHFTILGKNKAEIEEKMQSLKENFRVIHH
ncbi:MAG: 5-(carboxyamino)imidazole ribonucleotide synthase [Thermonemataceae bacterium]|nr:5-(carboxyamino)imidazole ribonucleotide synthase [Thermonemataceae bacterium]